MVGESGNRQSIQLRPFDNGGMDNLSINGGRVRSNEFLLDGAPNSNNEGGGSNTLSFVPSPDAVSEIRVQTNTYDAQYGRTGGGTIAVTVRSGTNQPHGTAYFYNRNKALNANLYENKVNGLPKSDVYSPPARIHLRRSDRAAEALRRPEQDVLLLFLRAPDIGDSEWRDPESADRRSSAPVTSRSRSTASRAGPSSTR